MTYDRQRVIDIALSEVGYLEKASNSQLDDKTANAGNKNFTKYARDLDALGFYNGRKQSVAWCDVFVDHCFVAAYGVEAALKLTCQPTKAANNCGAGCKHSRNYYKAKGQLYNNPEPGDQIFFYGSDGVSISHTGLVYKVDNKKVYTVEGNTSGSSGVEANGGGVFKKSYSLSYSRIAGYGRPKYGALNGSETALESPVKKDEEIHTETSKTPTEAEKKANTITIELDVLRNGVRGIQVKPIQRLLNAMGYNAGSVDGIFGNKTEAATKAFQKAKSLSVDGVIGIQTWTALLK